MTNKAFVITLCMIAGGALLLFFFRSSSQYSSATEYRHLRVETGEVTEVFRARKRFHESEPSISVRLESDVVIHMTIPSRKNISVGQSIDIEVLESGRNKRFYRLAQDPIAP